MPFEQIADLGPELLAAESELSSLAAAWEDRQSDLEEHAALTEMRQRMRRRWAIETGMIEGLYALDRGTTQLLIDRGLHSDLISHGDSDQPAEAVVAYLHDQAGVYDWLFDFIRSERVLSTSFVKELHRLLTRHQDTTEAIDGLGRRVHVPLLKGEWKRMPNNPTREGETVHEYTPPEQVASEMDRLVALHAEHVSQRVAPEVEAAWLHHRFTQIHPFQDGNGRVARAITSLVLLQGKLFPLSISPDEKAAYIGVLERADAGDLQPLIRLITGIQSRELRHALSIADDLSTEQKIFDAAFRKAKESRDERVATQEQVLSVGRDLVALAAQDFREARNQFNERMQREGLTGEFRASVYEPRDEKQSNWFFASVVTCAETLGYFADTRAFHQWIKLGITHQQEHRHTDLVLSAHSVGRAFKGVLAFSAFVEQIQRGEGGRTVRGPTLAVDDAFTFGYLERKETLEPKLRQWLETARLSLLRSWSETV